MRHNDSVRCLGFDSCFCSFSGLSRIQKERNKRQAKSFQNYWHDVLFLYTLTYYPLLYFNTAWSKTCYDPIQHKLSVVCYAQHCPQSPLLMCTKLPYSTIPGVNDMPVF